MTWQKQEEELREIAERSLLKSVVRGVVFASVAVGVVLGLHYSGLRERLSDVEGVKRWLESLGTWRGLFSVGIAALLIAVGVPRTWLAILVGAVFGVWHGVAVIHVAAVLGSVMTFGFARAGGLRQMAMRVAAGRAARLIDGNVSVTAIFLVRQLPVAGVVQNVALSASAVTWRVFVGGTFLGLLPLSVLMVLVGSGLAAEGLVRALAPLLAAVLLGASGGAYLVGRKRRAVQS